MALHLKLPMLLALEPDIAIVPESANEAILQRKSPLFAPRQSLWVGDNPNKGLSVFAFGEFSISLDSSAAGANVTEKWFIPVRVSGPLSFNLLAVWAFHRPTQVRRMSAGAIRSAVSRFEKLLVEGPAIAAGDFNDNVHWDWKGKESSFSNVLAEFGRIDMSSLYHQFKSARHGAEPEPTIYWRDRKQDGPCFHIDYCFASKSLQQRVRNLEIGTFEAWIANGVSDHVPVIVDFDETKLSQVNAQNDGERVANQESNSTH